MREHVVHKHSEGLVFAKLCFLFFILCVLFSSCHAEKNKEQLRSWMAQNGRVKVLCTTAQVAALVKAVGGTHVDSCVLISGQNDPHSYQIVKGDDEKFRRADIVFYSGLQLESGSTLHRYLHSPKAVACTEEVARQEGVVIWLSSVPDPHMWMDMSLWGRCTHLVAQRLSLLCPEFREEFEQNALQTEREYLLVHNALRNLFSTIPSERRYLVTTHDAFGYFCRAYMAEDEERRSGAWIERCAAPEGFAQETQISTQDLNYVVQYVKKHCVHAIFTESGMNKDSVQKVVTVCRELGLDVQLQDTSLYSDTMGDGDELSYRDMMEHDATVIVSALRGKM